MITELDPLSFEKLQEKKRVENDDELLNWDPNRTSPRKRNDLQILKELSSSLGSCHFFFGTDTTLYERKIWGEIDFQLYTVGCFLEFYQYSKILMFHIKR